MKDITKYRLGYDCKQMMDVSKSRPGFDGDILHISNQMIYTGLVFP